MVWGHCKPPEASPGAPSVGSISWCLGPCALHPSLPHSVFCHWYFIDYDFTICELLDLSPLTLLSLHIAWHLENARILSPQTCREEGASALLSALPWSRLVISKVMFPSCPSSQEITSAGSQRKEAIMSPEHSLQPHAVNSSCSCNHRSWDILGHWPHLVNLSMWCFPRPPESSLPQELLYGLLGDHSHSTMSLRPSEI